MSVSPNQAQVSGALATQDAEEDFVMTSPASIQDYANRRGYRPEFLGTAPVYRVPLPTLARAWRDDVVHLAPEAVGSPRYVLNYHHFSIAMSRSRRLALFSAVNLNGAQLVEVERRDRWRLDPRIPADMQTGEALYANNDLDRGHLVRRRDPVWGRATDAHLANTDTFHFTNYSPQHKDFNQKIWNDLENYILDNAGVHRLRVSVFTAPVFRASDRVYRGVGLPEQYWKVVVIVRAETLQLSATAYILSQTDLISGLEFAFGEFRTYQISVRQIEGLTGLGLGRLKTYDPKEGQPSMTLRPLDSLDQIVF